MRNIKAAISIIIWLVLYFCIIILSPNFIGYLNDDSLQKIKVADQYLKNSIQQIHLQYQNYDERKNLDYDITTFFEKPDGLSQGALFISFRGSSYRELPGNVYTLNFVILFILTLVFVYLIRKIDKAVQARGKKYLFTALIFALFVVVLSFTQGILSAAPDSSTEKNIKTRLGYRLGLKDVSNIAASELLSQFISREIEKQNYSVSKVVLLGHSKGGAEASLAYQLLAQNKDFSYSLRTFASTYFIDSDMTNEDIKHYRLPCDPAYFINLLRSKSNSNYEILIDENAMMIMMFMLIGATIGVAAFAGSAVAVFLYLLTSFTCIVLAHKFSYFVFLLS